MRDENEWYVPYPVAEKVYAKVSEEMKEAFDFGFEDGADFAQAVVSSPIFPKVLDKLLAAVRDQTIDAFRMNAGLPPEKENIVSEKVKSITPLLTEEQAEGIMAAPDDHLFEIDVDILSPWEEMLAYRMMKAGYGPSEQMSPIDEEMRSHPKYRGVFAKLFTEVVNAVVEYAPLNKVDKG